MTLRGSFDASELGAFTQNAFKTRNAGEKIITSRNCCEGYDYYDGYPFVPRGPVNYNVILSGFTGADAVINGHVVFDNRNGRPVIGNPGGGKLLADGTQLYVEILAAVPPTLRVSRYDYSLFPASTLVTEAFMPPASYYGHPSGSDSAGGNAYGWTGTDLKEICPFWGYLPGSTGAGINDNIKAVFEVSAPCSDRLPGIQHSILDMSDQMSIRFIYEPGILGDPYYRSGPQHGLGGFRAREPYPKYNWRWMFDPGYFFDNACNCLSKWAGSASDVDYNIDSLNSARCVPPDAGRWYHLKRYPSMASWAGPDTPFGPDLAPYVWSTDLPFDAANLNSWSAGIVSNIDPANRHVLTAPGYVKSDDQMPSIRLVMYQECIGGPYYWLLEVASWLSVILGPKSISESVFRLDSTDIMPLPANFGTRFQASFDVRNYAV